MTNWFTEEPINSLKSFHVINGPCFLSDLFNKQFKDHWSNANWTHTHLISVYSFTTAPFIHRNVMNTLNIMQYNSALTATVTGLGEPPLTVTALNKDKSVEITDRETYDSRTVSNGSGSTASGIWLAWSRLRRMMSHRVWDAFDCLCRSTREPSFNNSSCKSPNHRQHLSSLPNIQYKSLSQVIWLHLHWL